MARRSISVCLWTIIWVRAFLLPTEVEKLAGLHYAPWLDSVNWPVFMDAMNLTYFPLFQYVIFLTWSMSCCLHVVCSISYVFFSARISWWHEVANILLLWTVQVSWYCELANIWTAFLEPGVVSVFCVIQFFCHILRFIGGSWFYWITSGTIFLS